ncbi:efflux RND transporter periplasmic adaptor subunit [Sinimarinibacterium thermocellulolyticum]|uniref:Efflux RND transporter periplasmic adaptor subunit n=1 Tax=Sinimarinibacterium thermocellulolyticum TaxID=3170016 RepID=A0ABV2A9P0_9GAMM
MKTFPILAVSLVVVCAAGGAWWAAQRHVHEPVAEIGDDGAVYWTCAMHPEVRMDAPGNCPICGMRLVQKRAAARAAAAHDTLPTVEVAAQMVQRLGIRTALVERGRFWQRVDTVGRVEVDARRIRTLESRAVGWIEQQRVHAVGERVRAGETLAGVFAPELYAAQQELLLAHRSGDEALQSAARTRLQLLGADTAQIDAILRRGEAQRALPLLAPADGIVLDLDVHEGRQIAPGMPLARIADLSQVWIIAEIPEAQLGRITEGRPAEVRFAALPGQVFQGRIDYLYPGVDAVTRTARVRIVLDNPQWRLTPGMYAEVTLFGGARDDVLMVPSEALIRTGTRSVVILALDDRHFRPVEVVAGDERDGRTVILDGLKAGQRIVVSGQFLIDAEASLRGAFGRMAPAHAQATGDGP